MFKFKVIYMLLWYKQTQTQKQSIKKPKAHTLNMDTITRMFHLKVLWLKMCRQLYFSMNMTNTYY